MALFLGVAELAEALARETSRLKKRAAIAEAILRAHEDAPESADAGLFAMYVAGTPFAEADSRKLNAGGALLTKALLAVSGASSAELTAAYKRHGDLGAAGFDLLEASRAAAGQGRHPTLSQNARKDGAPGFVAVQASLTLAEVAEAFAGMAVARTTAVRAGLVEGLLRRATALEAKYLLKLMIGDMRIGVKQSLVEEAIAVAASKPTSESPDVGTPVLHPNEQRRSLGHPVLHPNEQRRSLGTPVGVAEVRNAVMLEADLSAAVRRAFAGTLAEARMRLFHPLGFMLASPVESPEEAVERFTGKPVVKVAKKGGKKVVEKDLELVGEGEDATATTTATAGPSTRAARLAQDDTSFSTRDNTILGLGGETTSNGKSKDKDNSKDKDKDNSKDKDKDKDNSKDKDKDKGNSKDKGEDNSKGKDEIQGSLHSATDDETVRCAGRDVVSLKDREDKTRREIEAFLEDKYDGMRAQVHCGDPEQVGRVAIYSRNREDVTESFPELEEAFALVGSAGVGPLIFDGEILGWDLSAGRALPFALLGQRIGRKRVSNEWREQIPVVFMAFDLMYADGSLMLELPLRERRNRLEAVVERLVEVVRSPLAVDERKKQAQGVMFAEADGEGKG